MCGDELVRGAEILVGTRLAWVCFSDLKPRGHWKYDERERKRIPLKGDVYLHVDIPVRPGDRVVCSLRGEQCPTHSDKRGLALLQVHGGPGQLTVRIGERRTHRDGLAQMNPN